MRRDCIVRVSVRQIGTDLIRSRNSGRREGKQQLIHSRNAQAALLLTFVGIGALIGLWITTALIFGDHPNLAVEIARVGRAEEERTVSTGRIPIPLISDVSLLITQAAWLPTRLTATAATIRTSSPESRFLIVDYEIVNDSDDTLLLEGFVNLFRVARGTFVVANGTDTEIVTGSTRSLYGVESDAQPPLESPAGEIYSGSWYFELDSRQPNLNLRSKLLGITLTLPIDINHPLQNR